MSAAAETTVARPLRASDAMVARRSLGARSSRAPGMEARGSLASIAYIAWSLWLIAVGVTLSA